MPGDTSHDRFARATSDDRSYHAMVGAGRGGCHDSLRGLSAADAKEGSAGSPRSDSQSCRAAQVERDMSNLLVELSAMARQITAQIDTRSAKLELLIREADEKIAALRAATPQTGGAPFSMPSPAAPRAEEHRTGRFGACRGVCTGRPGKSPREIAAQLGRPDGEIELILAVQWRDKS